MRKKILSIRITDEQHKQMQQHAKLYNVNLSKMIRGVVIDHIESV